MTKHARKSNKIRKVRLLMVIFICIILTVVISYAMRTYELSQRPPSIKPDLNIGTRETL
jgi:transposase